MKIDVSVRGQRRSRLLLAAVALGCNQTAAPAGTDPPAQLQVVSGQDQTAAPGAQLPNPVQVKVLDSAGAPVQGQLVVFKVTAGGGSMFAGVGLTNASGVTQDRWTLGANPLDSQRAEARAVDPTTGTELVFGVFRATAGPPPPPANHLNLIQLTAGAGGFCGVSADSLVYCWGARLGDTTGAFDALPTLVGGGFHYKRVAAGYAAHACAITTTVGAVCWGSNFYGQLGIGAYTGHTSPVVVSGGLDLSALAVGNGFSCGLTSSGVAYCWGVNVDGTLGTGDTVSSSVPVPVTGGLTFALLTAGENHACGVTATGSLYCWGANRFFQSGDSSSATCAGNEPCNLVPRLEQGAPSFVSLAAGQLYTCGVTASGVAYCWGSGGNGGLGDGTGSTKAAPTPVAGALRFQSVSAIALTTCALSPSGQASCWGNGEYGQIGSGMIGAGYDPRTPVSVVYGVSYTAIAAGLAATCAIATSGATYCWGLSYQGELGDGSTATSLTPIPIANP